MEIVVKYSCVKGFWNCLDATEWISLTAVVIAMMAAIASWLTIYSQERINKKNKEEIIIPGIKTVEANIENILSDWDQNKLLLSHDHFSKTTLPLWNFGSSPVCNIRYSYELEGVDKWDEAAKERQDIKRDYSIRISNENSTIEEKEFQTFIVEYENTKKNSRGILRSELLPFVRTLDVIKANEYGNIYIPNYYLILLNNYFFNELINDDIPPTIILNVQYDDVNLNTWRKKFRIMLATTHQISDTKLSTSLEYELIQDKKKHKKHRRVT